MSDAPIRDVFEGNEDAQNESNFDANNNGGQSEDVENKLATGATMRPKPKVQISEDTASQVVTGTQGGCATNQWHLLDVDGQSMAESLTSLSSLSSDDLEGRGYSTTQREKLRGRRALKRDNGTADAPMKVQNKVSDKQLAPTLVSACTILYALLPIASVLAFATLIALLFTRFWFVTILYYAYVIYDSKTCNKGGCRVEAFYRAKFWTYLAAYFPIQLKYSKNFKLDPNENYILNYHPHGISAFGCVSSFATNGLNFSERFPGIRSRFMVHETSFLVPVMREVFSFRGDCSVNSNSFDFILSKKWKESNIVINKSGGEPKAGNLLALCGGGLAEADLSNAEVLRIVAATRKGFIKKALIHGANLIPCIAFGENSVFKKVNFKPSSLLHRLETKFYNLFKFKHPIYYGKSILFGDKFYGTMPYKRPITVVMGDPIQVERVEQPSQDRIDQLHATYIERLKSVYDANRHLCTKYDTKLEVV